MNLKQDLDHHHPHQQQQLSDHSSDHLPHSNRRPRGFAVAASSSGDSPTAASGGLGKGPRREREKEKERTKLRERHRRAITSRMLAGLRQYGNFPLPARADMNDVLAALAREAGWIVEPDGTTYRSTPLTSAPPPQPPLPQLAPFKAALDSQSSLLRIERSLSPVSLDSIVVAERDLKAEKFASDRSPIESPECIEADELMRGGEECNGNFGGTPYIPFYVMLPVGIVNNYCQLVDPEALRQELRHLTALHVDGVVVTCWWGIIEGWSPQKYQWSGYRDVFNIIREFKLKFQAVMAFHEHGGNVSGDMPIPLPKWILEIGKDNQDIFFTDREGRRNTECLSWGIDKERVLKGRTGIEVCFDFMRSFRIEFHDFFEEGLVSAIEIGFGASGELKYPSFPERMGWRYPGIGEFQCYDRYLQQNLRRAAKLSGHSYWARGPDNAGYYNSRPYETGFFCDHGDYDSYYGRFFLRWYSQILIDHVDLVLSLAKLAFEGTQLVVKIPSVYWWYKTCSHPAELTAGFYNPTNRDGYSPVFEMLKKHSVTMKFICFGSQASNLDVDDALADPDGLSWQVLNSAWDLSLPVASQSAISCHDREAIIKVLEIAKPRNDPDHHHLSFFTFQPPSPIFMQGNVFLSEVDNFIKCMHGELSGDIEA